VPWLSALLSAVIFNVLIIIALVPLALRCVKCRPLDAARLLRRNRLIYGIGGIIALFPLDLAHRSTADRAAAGLRRNVMWRQILPGLRIKLFMTKLLGIVYPLVMTGIS